MSEWTWTVGRGEFIGQVSLLDPPQEVAKRLKRVGLTVGFVSDLEVHPERRGQGWANTLMTSLVRHADTHGIDLWTYISPFGPSDGRMSRGALLSYYSRWGFRPVERPVYEYEIVRRWHR